VVKSWSNRLEAPKLSLSSSFRDNQDYQVEAMRILFLAHRLPYPPTKGDKIRSFWQLRTLQQRHEVDLFCFYDDPGDRHQLTNVHAYCHSCYAERVSVFQSRIRAAAALLRGQCFSAAFFWSSSMARRIAEAVATRRYDLIFVFGSSMAQYAAPWPCLPRILDMVDVDSDKWAQYGDYKHGLLSRLWKLEGCRLATYEAALVRSFSNTLVCTEAEAQVLQRRVPEGRISVLQNWLDMDYFRPDSVLIPEKIRDLQPYVIFTGTMDYLPNIDAAQFFCREILPIVRSRVPDLRFVVAGRNPPPEVVSLAADPAIYVTGTVADIRPYLAGAAVAVAPMRIARGVQNKILEALAMDVPVVASSLAATALPQELASLLVAESEPHRFADRVTSYLTLSEPSRSRRDSVKRHFESLDLASQLEGYLLTASVRVAETRALTVIDRRPQGYMEMSRAGQATVEGS